MENENQNSGNVEQGGDAAGAASPEVQQESEQVVTGPAVESHEGDTVTGVLAAYVEHLRSQPGIIPEMVGGATLAEVQGNFGAAKAAYERVVAQVAQVAIVNPGQGGQAAEGVVQAPQAAHVTQASAVQPTAGAGGGARGNLTAGTTATGAQTKPSAYELILRGVSGNGSSGVR